MNKQLVNTILKGVGLAMGVATLTLSILGQIEVESAMALLSIGVVCLAIVLLQSNN